MRILFPSNDVKHVAKLKDTERAAKMCCYLKINFSEL